MICVVCLWLASSKAGLSDAFLQLIYGAFEPLKFDDYKPPLPRTSLKVVSVEMSQTSSKRLAAIAYERSAVSERPLDTSAGCHAQPLISGLLSEYLCRFSCTAIDFKPALQYARRLFRGWFSYGAACGDVEKKVEFMNLMTDQETGITVKMTKLSHTLAKSYDQVDTFYFQIFSGVK